MLYGLLVDLVPPGDEFLRRYIEWVNGPMREWWRLDGLLSHSAWDRQLEAWFSQPENIQHHIWFGVQTKTGALIGSFALFNLNEHNRTGELSAGIGDPTYWGGGYGSDATLLLVEYAFRWLDLRRVWLTTMGSNIRAQRQVEKCGFVCEGARRSQVYSNGQYVDHVYYGLLREEWPGRDVMVERLGLRDKVSQRG